MSAKFIIFIIIHLTALVYFVELLRRVATRSKEYDLNENNVTLPFGFIRLRHIIFFYILAYILWVAGTVFLYKFYIEPEGFTFWGINEAPAPEGQMNLNF